jgi:hypothetical protein
VNPSDEDGIVVSPFILMAEQRDPKKIYAEYWEKLETLHPTEVSQRTETVYLYDKGGFQLPFLNQYYLVIPKDRKILEIRPDETRDKEPLSMDFYLISLIYLTEARTSEPTRRWISEKDMRGGEMFFRGPHALPLAEVTEKYGNNPDAFIDAGKRLGGVQMLYGDRAFGLDLFPKIPLVYVLWTADQEFGPRIQVLFDETIQDHLPLDVVWCAVSEVNRRLVRLEL